MRLIHQAGNQAKYVATAVELCELAPRCPGFQRTAVEEHVDEIVAYHERALAERGYVTFPGCIVLCRYEGNMHCIDGQHRLGAIEKLRASGINFELVVEVFTCRDAAEVHALFRVVNSNRPIPNFLLDDTDIRSVALAIRDHVRGTYSAFVSRSARPNVPNVNLDAFTQAVIDKYGTAVGTDVGAWIDARNAEHKELLVTLKTRYEKVANGVAAIEREYKSAAKSRGAKFYLGCYWLEAPRNTALSKPLRALVWRGWYATVPHDASGDAMCPCCESARISALDFHLGHKTSFARGGTDEPSNLIPLCAMCNTSMGTRDFDEYRAALHGARGARGATS